MKEVKITVVCEILCLEYCSQYVMKKYIAEEDPDADMDDAFANCYYATYGMENIEALYVNDNEEENLIKKKGKYVKTKEFFHDLWSENSEHPLPIELHARIMPKMELEYNIKLEDDEEFDIKKVQFVKSDYEFDICPYFIIADHILYDGKEIGEYGYLCDVGIEGRSCDKFVVESLYDN